MCVEYKLRGWVEKELDKLVQPEYIDNIVAISRRFPLKSTDDFCFGFIVGCINHGSQAQALFYFKREITREEWDEVMEIIERRTMEIRGKIKLALGR